MYIVTCGGEDIQIFNLSSVKVPIQQCKNWGIKSKRSLVPFQKGPNILLRGCEIINGAGQKKRLTSATQIYIHILDIFAFLWIKLCK